MHSGLEFSIVANREVHPLNEVDQDKAEVGRIGQEFLVCAVVKIRANCLVKELQRTVPIDAQDLGNRRFYRSDGVGELRLTLSLC